MMIRKLFSASAVNAIGAVISYSLVVFLARLGADGSYGDFLYALTWALVIGSFLDFAAEAVFAKYAQHEDSLKQALSVVLSLRAIGMLLVIIFFLLANFYKDTLNFKVFLLMVPIFYMGPLFEYLNKNLTFVIILLAEKLVMFSLIYLLTVEQGFSDIIYVIYFFANCLSLALQIFLLRKDLGIIKVGIVSAIGDYMSLYYGMFFVLQLHLVYGYFTRFIIESRNGIEAFASVAIALQMINATSLFQSQVDRSFRMPIFVAVTKYCSRDAKLALMRYFLFTTFPILIGCAVIFFGAEIIGGLFFPEGYEGLILALKILSLTPLSVNLIRLGDALFTALHRVKVNMYITMITVCALLLATLSQTGLPYSVYLFYLVIVQLSHGLCSVLFGLWLYYSVRTKT